MICLLAVVFESCIYDDFTAEGTGNAPFEDRTVLKLNIRSVNVGTSSATPVEKIKSLRAIIINSGDSENPSVIECNRTIELPEMTAAGLEYSFYWPSVEGVKQIYIIANESSISQDMTELLDAFKENSEADTLLDFLTDYSFEPSYTVNSDDNIYLPYSYHNKDLNVVQGEVNNVAAYLVPVATKFIFNFINYREDAVNVNGISMEYANKSNYLFAKVGPTDIAREFDGTYYYWVEWLAKVSEESWKNTGFTTNEDFNKLYGWISDYEMPDDNDSDVFEFVAVSETFPVDAATEDEEDGKPVIIPYKKTVGPFYVPESKNLIAPDSSEPLTQQMYYLTIGLEDTAVGSTAPEFISVPIPNLGALFRDTYVIVNINMSGGDIEVYAQIAEWTQKTAYGIVNEVNPPNPNPFASPKK